MSVKRLTEYGDIKDITVVSMGKGTTKVVVTDKFKANGSVHLGFKSCPNYPVPGGRGKGIKDLDGWNPEMVIVFHNRGSIDAFLDVVLSVKSVFLGLSNSEGYHCDECDGSDENCICRTRN